MELTFTEMDRSYYHHIPTEPLVSPTTTRVGIDKPTNRDVVGGRGQGVQRLPGNRKYRALISMNKVRRFRIYFCTDVHRGKPPRGSREMARSLVPTVTFQGIYARCHQRDKTKVSKVSERAAFGGNERLVF